MVTLPNTSLRRPRSLRRKHLLLRRLARLLPLALTLLILPLYIPIFTTNRQSHSRHDLHFLKLTLSASAATLHPTTSLTSAAGSILQELPLHIPTWYTVSLYTSCQGGNWESAVRNEAGAYDEKSPSYCSPPKAAYYFNPATIAGLDTSSLRGDAEYTSALARYKKGALALFILYIISVTTTSVSAFLYIIHLLLPVDWRPYEVSISRPIALLAKTALGLQVCATVITAATTAFVYFSLQNMVNAKLGRLGVTAIVGQKMLNFSSGAGMLNLCSVVAWCWISYWSPRCGDTVYWPGRRRDFPLAWRNGRLVLREESSRAYHHHASAVVSSDDDDEEAQLGGRFTKSDEEEAWDGHGARISQRKNSDALGGLLRRSVDATNIDRDRFLTVHKHKQGKRSSSSDLSGSSTTLVGAGCEKERLLKVQIRDISPAGSSAASSATVVADDEEESMSSESGDGVERILKRKLRDKWAWAEEEEDEGDDEGTDRDEG